MELKFKPERLTIIKRLRGLNITEIDARMMEISGANKRYNIDRWERLYGKHPFERVELLAKATEVPVGFYYFNAVDIEMKNLKVEIYIYETGERTTFNLLQPCEKK